MRTIAKITLLPVSLLALACGRSESDSAASGLSEDLQNDLASASAASIQLATTSRAYQPTRFVSAIEQPMGTAPDKAAPAKRRVPRKASPRVVAEATSPAPEAEPVIESAPAPEVVESEPAPAPAPEVATAPRPTPVSFPAGGDVGRGPSGPSIGDVIGVVGVVIRGGNGGVDHCEIHDRRGRRTSPNQPHAIPGGGFPGGVLVGARFPIGRGTFPR